MWMFPDWSIALLSHQHGNNTTHVHLSNEGSPTNQWIHVAKTPGNTCLFYREIRQLMRETQCHKSFGNGLQNPLAILGMAYGLRSNMVYHITGDSTDSGKFFTLRKAPLGIGPPYPRGRRVAFRPLPVNNVQQWGRPTMAIAYQYRVAYTYHV